MRKYLFVLLIIPFILFSKPKNTILINIKSKSNLPAEFEESISVLLEKDYDYDVVEPHKTNSFGIDEEAMDLTCKTKACYKELFKKLKSSYMISFLVNSVPSIYSKKYRFRVVLVDLKTGNQEGEKSFFYKERLSNVSFLSRFSKKIIPEFFFAIDKDKAVAELKRMKKIPENLTKKDVVTMIKEVYPDIKSCGKDFNFKGVVKVRFKLNNNKTMSDIKFITSIKDDLLKCLVKVMNKVKVKEFTGESIFLTFPFKLD